MSGLERRKSNFIPSFLRKTLQILDDPLNVGVCCWAPEGRGFLILNEQDFAKIVLPRYFKHSNYSSFVRQLNMYSFHKIRETGSQSYFYHELFHRGSKYSHNIFSADIALIKRKAERKKRILKDKNEQESSKARVTLKLAKSKDQYTKASEEIKSSFQLIARQQDDEQISIAERVNDYLLIQPPLGTRELMYPSKGNIFLSIYQAEPTSLYSLTNLIK